MIKTKLEKMSEVSDEIVPILQEYADVMPPELPKKFPPRNPTNHQIELVPRAKLPAQVPYRMTPLKLVEFRKHLIESLDAGLIQSLRALYRAPVLFQKKQDGSL